MSNPYFDFTASPYRFVSLTLVRASAVNSRLDEVTTGFDLVKVDMDLKAPLASPTLTGTVTMTGATSVLLPSPGAVTDDSSKAASTAWVQDLVGSLSVGLPLQTGKDDYGLFTTGTTAEWREAARVVLRQIFQENSGLVPASSGDPIGTGIYAPAIGTLSGSIAYGSGVYVIGTSSASTTAASSADGKTWVGRTMPASKTWVFGSDGTNFLAVVASDTATAVSSNGTSWSSATALGAGVTGVMPPIKVGGLWLVIGTQTTYYTSTDGVAWTSRTLPATPQTNSLRLVGTTAWVRTGSTTAYTSADGINWTIRTITNFNITTIQHDGTLIGFVDLYSDYQQTSDGVNWSSSATPNVGPIGPTAIPALINGVHTISQGTDTSSAWTYAGGRWVQRANRYALTITAAGNFSVYACTNRGVLGGRFISTDPATATRIGLIENDASTVAYYK